MDMAEFSLHERRNWHKYPSINVVPAENVPTAPLSGKLVSGFMMDSEMDDHTFTPPREDSHFINASTDSQRSHEKTVVQRRFSGDVDFSMNETPPTRGSDMFEIRSPLQNISDVSNAMDEEMQDLVIRSPPRPKLEKKKSFLEQKDYTVPTLQRNASVLRYALHYHTHELLGKGDFGEVWSATHYQRSHEWYALKIGTKRFRGSKERDKYLKEIKCVAELGDHNNIVKYHRAWQDGGRFYIAMQLCRGGTLQDSLQAGNLSLEQIDAFTTGILKGLQHIHNHGLLHLDLKPENLFLDAETTIRIGDFGLCMPEAEWDEQEGDKRYLAPEILQGNAHASADIFSMGLILYQMLSNIRELPGDGQDWHYLRSGAVDIPAPPSAAPHFNSFASAAKLMLAVEPTHRPTAGQLLGV